MRNWYDKVVIIAPHSDDETLSLGGTICDIKKKGGEVRVVVAVAGDIVFWHNGRIEVPAEQRVKELDGAMKHLGVDSWRVIFKERNLESRLDTIPIRELIYELGCITGQYKYIVRTKLAHKLDDLMEGEGFSFGDWVHDKLLIDGDFPGATEIVDGHVCLTLIEDESDRKQYLKAFIRLWKEVNR